MPCCPIGSEAQLPASPSETTPKYVWVALSIAALIGAAGVALGFGLLEGRDEFWAAALGGGALSLISIGAMIALACQASPSPEKTVHRAKSSQGVDQKVSGSQRRESRPATRQKAVERGAAPVRERRSAAPRPPVELHESDIEEVDATESQKPVDNALCRAALQEAFKLLDEARKSPDFEAWQFGLDGHQQPTDHRIAELEKVRTALSTKVGSQLGKDGCWSNESFLQQLDQLIVVSYAMGYLSLMDLPKLQQGGDEFVDQYDALFDDTCYLSTTFFKLPYLYHRGRMDSRTATQEVTDSHADRFYEREGRLARYRALYNDYCARVANAIPRDRIEHEAGGMRYINWTQPDRTKASFRPFPDVIV